LRLSHCNSGDGDVLTIEAKPDATQFEQAFKDFHPGRMGGAAPDRA